MNALSVLTLLPLVWLIFALIKLKWQGHIAVLSTLALALILAIPLWKMLIPVAVTSVLEGAVSAIWPIFVIILAAMFTYDLSIKTGGMDAIKQMLASISNDRRMLILIICWAFGGFMEGMAGFGTAVAIPAAMLVALGMNPIKASVAAILNNAFPTAFGAVGIPILTLSQVTGLDAAKISFGSALQMAPLMLIVPFALVMIAGEGIKALKGMIIPCLVAAFSFLIPELAITAFTGPELAVTLASIVSLVALILYVRIFKPKTPEQYVLIPEEMAKEKHEMSYFVAWLPYILILIFLLGTSKLVPPVNSFFAQFHSSIKICTATSAKALNFNWINMPGIWIFLATIIAGFVQGVKAIEMWKTFIYTFKRMLKTAVTIIGVLAVAKVMTYSGMIKDMATLFVSLTGRFYPFVSPLIAAIGAFVTGSGTNTQVLIGPLQFEAAKSLDMSPYWLAAANQMGGGLGKVLSPQCIAIVVAATGLAGKESEIMRASIKWVGLFLLLAMLIVGLTSGLFHQLVSWL